MRVGKWLVVALVVHWAYHTFAGDNFTAVVPGRVYRSAQLDERGFERLVKANDVRTVVNLRGCNHWEPWYQEETAFTQINGIDQEDVTLSAHRFPAPAEIRRLVEVFDHAAYPIVIHCKKGSDRTGLAVGLLMLLATDATVADARRECSYRDGHFRALTTARMDEVFDRYEAWLAGRPHRPEFVREWLLNVYQPGEAVSELALVEPPKITVLHSPVGFRLKATNSSAEPWRLRAGSYAGVHVHYQVFAPDGSRVWDARAAQYDATVAPGETIMVRLPTPPLRLPGRYTLHASMALPKHVSFQQLGDEPISYSWDVR